MWSVLLQNLPLISLCSSVWFWAPGHAAWGRPSNCPCLGLRWWCWRRGRPSPGTTSSTCGRTPSAISAASEPRSSTESSAPDLWITSVSLLVLVDSLTRAWSLQESLWISRCYINVSKFNRCLSSRWPVFLVWLLGHFFLIPVLLLVVGWPTQPLLIKVFTSEKTCSSH